jgi:hypothetical protein
MQIDNLRALTDSIKAGERVVLFPPGMFSLIALVLLLVINTVLITSSLINIFFTEADFKQQALFQFSSLGISFLLVILPNLMVLSGKKKFSILSYYYSWLILVFSVLMLALGLSGLLVLNKAAVILTISFIVSLSCIFIYRSAAYLLVKEFFYLLKNPEANE